MYTRVLSVCLPDDLVDEMDKVVKRSFATRSEFIRGAIRLRLNQEIQRKNDEDIIDKLAAEITASQQQQQPAEPAESDEIYKLAGFANFAEFKKYIYRK